MAVSGELTVCKAPAKLKLPWYSKTFFKVGRSATRFSTLIPVRVCVGPDGHPTLFGDVATGLGGAVRKNSAGDGGFHIKIYIYLFTRGLTPTVPSKSTKPITLRPYLLGLQCVA